LALLNTFDNIIDNTSASFLVELWSHICLRYITYDWHQAQRIAHDSDTRDSNDCAM